MLTGHVQKERYVYYRCTSHRGKCDLPRFHEEDIADRLGEPLKGLQGPPEIVSQIVATVREDQKKALGKGQCRANLAGVAPFGNPQSHGRGLCRQA